MLIIQKESIQSLCSIVKGMISIFWLKLTNIFKQNTSNLSKEIKLQVCILKYSKLCIRNILLNILEKGLVSKLQ